MYPNTERKFEGSSKPREHEQPHELSETEIQEQEDHNARLNEMMYGGGDGFSQVEAARYRETEYDINESATLRIAESSASNYSDTAVKEELTSTREQASDILQQHGGENGRFGDLDTRMAAETERAETTGTLSKEGTLHEDYRVRAEKAYIAEELMSEYIDGRNTELFESVDPQLAQKIKAAMGALLQKYGDHTKASNEELSSIFDLIQTGENTAESTEENSIPVHEDGIADPQDELIRSA